MPRKAPEITAIQVEDPSFFRSKNAQELVLRALATFGQRPWTQDELVALCQELLNLVKGEGGVWVGYENKELKALNIVSLPKGPFGGHPQIIHWYNEGGNALKREMCKQLIAFLSRKGYDYVWAINQTGRPDSVWARGMTPLRKSLTIGSVVQFGVGGEGR